MKHSLKIIGFSMMLVTVVSLMMTSCGQKDTAELLDNVPADADVVIKVNAEKIIENTGSTVSDGKIQLSAELDALVNQFYRKDKKLIDKVLESGCVDYTSLIFAQKGEDVFGLVSVTDESKLKSIFKDLNMKFNGNGDWDVTDNNGGFYLHDGILWIGHTDDLDNVKKFQKAASENPYSSLNWQSSYLQEDAMFNALFNVEKLDGSLKVQLAEATNGDAIKKGFIALKGNLAGQSLKVIGQCKDSAGKKITFGNNVKNLDTFFMKYLSDKDIAVLAMSLPENYDWGKAISQAILAYGGYCDDDTREKIAAVLNNFEGTLAIGAGPSGSLMSFVNPSPNNWDVVVAVQTKSGKADELIAQLSKVLTDTGLNVESDGNGGLTAGTYGFNVSIKKDGDAIVVSNRSLYPSQGTDINANVFSGKTGEFIAQIPKDNSILSSLGVPFGVQIDASTANDELNIEVKLLDTKELFLAGIIKLVTDKL
jgi:hypothetical protein